MKSINKIFILFLIAAVGFGCNKKLDVEPKQNITPEQIRNGDDVKAVLFGAYSLLQGANAFGQQYFMTSDLIADTLQLSFVGTFTDYTDLANKRQIAQNSLAAGLWGNSYTIINVCNTVIDKIELVDESERDAVLAEARFIRGTVYFELVNFFGLPFSDGQASTNPGVPLVDKPYYSYDASTDKLPRNTVAEVYNFVVEDLTFGRDNLPEDNSTRATTYAASGILSRVYLNMRNYQGAATEANTVIESGAYSLTNSYAAAFNNAANSSEDIFAIQQTSQSNSGVSNNGINTFYAANDLPAPLLTGRGEAQADTRYLSNFSATDTRGDFFYEGSSITGIDGVYTGKWQQFYKVIPVIRLAEMYLTRGEANLMSGSSIGPNTPLEDLNEIRSRAGALPVALATEAAFRNERFLELGFEGDRLWTLKRQRQNVGNYPYNANLLVLPIPQRERDVNPNLAQNGGYF